MTSTEAAPKHDDRTEGAQQSSAWHPDDSGDGVRAEARSDHGNRVRRWVQFQLPVMVAVEVSPQGEEAAVGEVVLIDRPHEVVLARDVCGRVLVYDQFLHQVDPMESTAIVAIRAVDHMVGWPEAKDWQRATNQKGRQLWDAPEEEPAIQPLAFSPAIPPQS